MSQCFFDLAELKEDFKGFDFLEGYETETKLTEGTLPCREGFRSSSVCCQEVIW